MNAQTWVIILSGLGSVISTIVSILKAREASSEADRSALHADRSEKAANS